MNYKIIENKVIEVQTGLVIYEGKKEDLKKKIKQLNSGAGFRGFTPEFLLEKMNG